MAGKYVPPGRRGAPDGSTPSATEETTPAKPSVLSNARQFFSSESSTFRELQMAKKEFAENPQVEDMFDKQRVQSTEQPISKTFAEQFYTCMEDINETAGSILAGTVSSYIDLGCSPGGFSSWVMEKNPTAKGLGFTLPPAMGGLPMVRMPEGGYNVCYIDITQLEEVETKVAEQEMREVDLVTAACIYRDQETAKSHKGATQEPTVASASRTVLSLSQIHIALKSLKSGAHFVFVLSNKPDPAVIQTLALLRSLFDDITPCKGKSLHGIRSSFYLFCKGFNRSAYEERKIAELILSSLRKTEEVGADKDAELAATVEYKLSRSTLDGSAPTESLHPADLIWLPGYTDETLLQKEGPFVATFFEGLWNGQIKAIKRKTEELNQKSKPIRRGITPGSGESSWRTRSEVTEDKEKVEASEPPAGVWRRGSGGVEDKMEAAEPAGTTPSSGWRRGAGTRTVLTRREPGTGSGRRRKEEEVVKPKVVANRYAGLEDSEEVDNEDED